MITKTVSKKRKPAAKTAKKASGRLAASKVAVEKRSSERSQFFAAATLYTEVNPDFAHTVWMTNLSLGGVSFKTRREYNEGESFHIRLEAGPVSMDCPVRVVWARKNSDGFSEVGCEFIPD